MTERRSGALEQCARSIRVGPSWMSWNGTSLDVWVDEIGCPLPRRVRGRITLTDAALNTRPFAIDQRGRHVWQPLATPARIGVDLEHPRMRWQGSGYLDTNYGSEPLEAAFRSWSWGRATTDGRTVVQYDVLERSGSRHAITVALGPDGVAEADLPRVRQLAATAVWRIARSARADETSETSETKVLRTLEDTPFYSRSLIGARILGADTHMVHESLDLGRFSNPVVKAMLPFRMPRRFI